MKARVIETGKWIDVCRKETLSSCKYVEYGTEREYYANQLALENDDKLSSYWFDMRTKYAGLAMQALLSSHYREFIEASKKTDEPEEAIVASIAIDFADALITELKKGGVKE